MSLVETDWLEKNLDKVKIIDCSWHMPQTKRIGLEEYKIKHIPNSIFFDLDKNSKRESNLPHMLVNLKEWEIIVSNMGINNNDLVVIYDNSDVLSACRCWYNFIYFGHSPKLIKVLNGGFQNWVHQNKITNSEIPKLVKTNYRANEIKSLVKTKNEINENIIHKIFEVIDARSVERFKGEVKEPRTGLRSGNIENSTCIPYNQLINSDNKFKAKKDLIKIFKKNLKDISANNVVFSCGSGVTACVLALAYSLINDKYLPKIYDGSWAEYGKI
tara:strand:- start:8117 stop:8932 length:816 start_codon:yes stop_codon:yes gene_type:complete